MTSERRKSDEAWRIWADGHETLCGERDATTKMRLGRLERLALLIVGEVFIGGAIVLWQIIKVHEHLGG